MASNILVVGRLQSGKSTLINCLLDEYVAFLGAGTATTKTFIKYMWGEELSFTLHFPDSHTRKFSKSIFLNGNFYSDILLEEVAAIEARFPREILRSYVLIDSPGFNSSDVKFSATLKYLKKVNYAIFVLNNSSTPTQNERKILRHLALENIPYTILLNCHTYSGLNRSHPHARGNVKLINETKAVLDTEGLISDVSSQDFQIFPCNLYWYWISTTSFNSLHSFNEKNSFNLSRIKQVFISREIKFSNYRLMIESNFLAFKHYLFERLYHLFSS